MHSHVLRIVGLHFLVLLFTPATGQHHVSDLDSLYAELDSLFADEAVPANLFELADSLLALEDARISALSLRAGYVSQVVSAGRNFGIDQYGFSPAASYFHHSGIGAGVTGYWSNEFSPSYYLTDLSVSYNYIHKEKLTFLINHAFYIYDDTLADHSFSKSLQASANYHHKFIDAGVDYSYLYGNETAHRLVAHANGNFKFKFKGFIDAVSFMPGISMQWGNADIVYWRQPRTALSDLYWLIRDNKYPRLGRGDYLKLAYLLENNRTPAATFFLRQRDYTDLQINNLFDAYYDGSFNLQDTFGFMNFSVSLPVVVRSGRFSLLLNYTFNQPQALPGENYSYDSNSFFSSSLSYMFSWIKK